jgi:hypothetical protein
VAASGEGQSRLRWTAAGAVGLHALLLTLVQGGDRAERGNPVAMRMEPIEIEVAAEPDARVDRETAMSDRAMTTSRRETSPSVGTAPRANARAESANGAARATAVDSTPPEPSPGAEPSTTTAPSEPRAESPHSIDLGIANGDWSRWVAPTAANSAVERRAPPRVTEPVSRTGGLVEALEAHDREVGLGPAGGVLTAARDAAHTDVAPQLGRATFAITLLSTGQVQVELTAANASVDAWRTVAATMQAALARKPPSIPGKRNGVVLKLEVVAEEHWPNGTKARDESTALTVVPPQFQGVDEAKEDLARRNPLAADPVPAPGVDKPPLRLNVRPPGVFLEHHGKVCNYAIGVTPLALAFLGGCDPSNIGAKPVRVVSTRIVSEKAL